ncbi:MAG: hypothetical protein IGS39_04750 [Calothrix sp. C42_A2020_038]|nr:hypothetical protein [Calothrix sp. C42_A2020_038]
MHVKSLIRLAALSSLFAGFAYIPQGIAQNAPEQSTARQMDRRYNMTFESRGCQRSNLRVICDVIVTNFTDSHRQVSFGVRYAGYQTRLVDNAGNVYTANALQLNQYQSARERILIELAPGIPKRFSYSFRVPQGISELSAIDIGYQVIGRVDTTARITIPNIGNITATNAQKN